MVTAVASGLERAVRRLGAGCVVAGCVAWSWALLARQAPTSPLHVAGAPPSIEQLATRAWLVGLCVCVLGPAGVRAVTTEARARWLLWAATAGALCSLGALAVAARVEVPGVQLVGATGLARGLAYARVLGDAALLGSLGLALRGWLRGEKNRE